MSIKAFFRDTTKDTLQNVVARNSFYWRLSAAQRKANDVCLTFDDGPHEVYTPKMLDVLSSCNVKAIFFLLGDNIRKAPHLLERIVNEGHAVGGHTFSHQEINEMSVQQLEDQLNGVRELIREISGVDSSLFRPPRGVINSRSVFFVKKAGFKLIHWSVTHSDYLKNGEDALLERIRLNEIKAGNIALYHDNNEGTVGALKRVIPNMLNNGMQFVTHIGLGKSERQGAMDKS